jgi:hypothetical protein
MGEGEGEGEVSHIQIRRLFELYVEELHSEAEAHDEVLLVRLRGLAEDTQKAIDRIQQTPTLAVQIVRALSLLVQELDADAGFSRAKHEDLDTVRRWALVMLANGHPVNV